MKNEKKIAAVELENSSCSKKKCCRSYTKITLFSFAIIISAFLVRDGLINIQKNRNIVSVKGLAEKVVKSDSAVWVIPINSIGDDFDLVKSDIDDKISKIMVFLKKYEIKDSEIEQDAMRVYDKLAQRYYDENNKAKRFSIDHQLIIKTENVDAMQNASNHINELLKDGITTSYDGYNAISSPRYLFTKLNDIKPEMLSQAMKEAKKAADELVKDSGSKINGIKNAAQGIFSIYSREATSSGSGIDQRVAYGAGMAGQYSTNEAYFIEKVVRIVASVDYYLEKE